jgi:protein-S-isoprenylcysteine O-methyltransferase Ste14
MSRSRKMAGTTNSAMPLPPDGYAAVIVGAALLLEWLLPLRLLPGPSFFGATTLIGVAIAAGGFVLESAAARAIVRAGSTTRPNGAPHALATGGVFSRSRNPFYCGLILVLAGIFLATGLDWGIAFLPVLWLALDRLVVPFEERRLEAAFGEIYRDYVSLTRRWV